MSADRLSHRRSRFLGRDPDEEHRGATPLELLFDLTIVVAFGIAADELAHMVADGHARPGVVAFAFAAFAITLAWLNYSWFASAYDTDDWVFRLATMVQMAGLIVLALGLPQMFASVDHGDTLDADVMVAGYVVMRIALVSLWLLVVRQDDARQRAARTYAGTIAVSQTGWVLIAFSDLPVATMFALFAIPTAVELVGPIVAERRIGLPWHARHIAERYGLLVIITLGEVILGTVAALNVLVHGEAGWTLDAALLLFAGIALTFGCWWMYFIVPWAQPLLRHRERGFLFGYGHLMIFAPLAAMGAGLHVAAYALEGKASIGTTAVVLSVVIPVAIYVIADYALYSLLVRTRDPFHLWLLAGTAAVLAVAVVLAEAGLGLTGCLLVVMLAPVVTIVGYETLGYRHMADALEHM